MKWLIGLFCILVLLTFASFLFVQIVQLARPAPNSEWAIISKDQREVDFQPIEEGVNYIAGYEVVYQLDTPYHEKVTFKQPASLDGVCVGSAYLQKGTFYYKEGFVEWRETCTTDYGGPGFEPVLLDN